MDQIILEFFFGIKNFFFLFNFYCVNKCRSQFLNSLNFNFNFHSPYFYFLEKKKRFDKPDSDFDDVIAFIFSHSSFNTFGLFTLLSINSNEDNT